MIETICEEKPSQGSNGYFSELGETVGCAESSLYFALDRSCTLKLSFAHLIARIWTITAYLGGCIVFDGYSCNLQDIYINHAMSRVGLALEVDGISSVEAITFDKLVSGQPGYTPDGKNSG